ncbi:MAG TPA: cation:proton antiporter [Paludibacteraceae bacterium]|nr:cation:proton antiporter [Paludibacteraceae bacterium]HPH62734.1 cation:proton antiporter [Paludibacteraceae bacterium]
MKELFSHIDFNLPLSNPILIFSLVLFIILFAPLILDRFRIPHIIGLILSGLVLGENGFNILSRDDSFQLFGTVGILYLMFLAGLEMDLTDFKKNKTKGIYFGMMTFLIPMVIGAFSGYFLIQYFLNTTAAGDPVVWRNGFDSTQYLYMSTILLASMYASHTLLSYPIVSRFGVTKNTSVSITIGGTMITTTLALLILAVIVAMSKGDLKDSFWIQLIVSILIYCFIVIYIFPKIACHFFKCYEDSILQYIFVLAMVFLGSFLAQLAGLEPIIGAFLVGLSLNRFIPRISPLMNRLDFVGNAIFIPFFLIGVGMLINVKVVFSGFDTLIAAVVMTVVATLSKYLAAVVTRRRFGMTKAEGLMIFGLSNAQAAATLAAVMIGRQIVMGHTSDGMPIYLFNDDILNGTIIMILVTCTISSLATERAARKLATQLDRIDNEMTEEKLVDRILIPLYNPDTLNSLMELAVLLKVNKSKEPLYALNVANDSQDNSCMVKGKKMLEKAARIASATDNTMRMISRYDANVTSGIIHTIKENGITEVVMGLHHKAHFADSFFGAKTENLLKVTNQMILVFKSIQPLSTIKRVIVAVPAKAEFEVGFVKWYDRVKNISKQIGATTTFFAHPDTLEQIKILARRNKFGVETFFETLDNWDDFLILTREVMNNDLLVVISSRKTAISYNPSMDKLPMQLSKYFANNSFIVLYPDQFEDGTTTNVYI